MADENNISVKVAKYSGGNRVDLVESNEYGYVSLIKATKSVLDKIALENRTITEITSKERREQRLWNAIALREAIINAFVHNDYTREIAPKFEIFKDRIEITSAGSLPEGLSESEFFEGFSIPRNKELMRIFKDLDLVEQLGSGIPRILEAYGRDCFQFSDNFLRMVFPAAGPVHATEQDTEQDTEQVTEQAARLLSIIEANKEYSGVELMVLVGIKHRPTFLYNYLQPAIDSGLILPTKPEKPTSSKQKYRITEKGKKLKMR